ncbi:MAG: hypothetical protein LBH43_15420 [Treponema sp.]|nr:hypothetical protein [Treponema sp.]
MGQFIDLTGKRFGRLTVIERAENGSRGNSRWACKCDCGKMIVIRADHLRSRQHKISCGCFLFGKKTHGDSGKRLYRIWVQMKLRCENQSSKESRDKKNYRDRGIRVCQEWHDYKVFKAWALKNGYNDNLSIDRIDNNGNYEPSNCRWADIITQANNTRRNINIKYNGKTMTLKQWSTELGIKYRTLSWRIMESGWSIEAAFTTPVNMRYSHTKWRKVA